MLKIMIVDDQILMREGLRMILDKQDDMTVVAACENGLEAIQAMEASTPDLVLMDIRMPVMNGIEAVERLKEQHPEVIVLILTTFNEEDYIIEALAKKANGFLLKNMEYPALLSSIRQAAEGMFVMPPEAASKLANRIHLIYDSNAQFVNMNMILKHLKEIKWIANDREEEVVKGILGRKSNKEIAAALYISEGTAKNYVSDVYKKMGVNNRQEAIRFLHEIAKIDK